MQREYSSESSNNRHYCFLKPTPLNATQSVAWPAWPVEGSVYSADRRVELNPVFITGPVKQTKGAVEWMNSSTIVQPLRGKRCPECPRYLTTRPGVSGLTQPMISVVQTTRWAQGLTQLFKSFIQLLFKVLSHSFTNTLQLLLIIIQLCALF